MTTINELRKLHEEYKSFPTGVGKELPPHPGVWSNEQIDALFAEIDRLRADNDRLARELAATKGATTTRTIPPLSAVEIEFLDSLLGYDPDDAKAQRNTDEYKMLLAFEKLNLVLSYLERDGGKAWTISSWGRDVAHHYDIAQPVPVVPPPAATTTTSDAGRKLTKAQRRELAKFDHPDGLGIDYPQNGGEPQPDGDVTRSMFYKLSALKLIERVTDETEIVRGFGGKVWRRYYYTTTESGRAALAGRGA